MDVAIRRALISVSDKTNLESLAKCFNKHQVQIISTGGTAKQLISLGYSVIDISEFTGAPEMMDGRVKTLHPKVHGGLLACLDNPSHRQAMQAHGIESIDVVIVNLYPFEATVEKGASFEEIIENIDIGGPSMVRSAAKNYRFTTIITDPKDYTAFIDEMESNQGKTTEAFRYQMAIKAFTLTAHYDAAISQWFHAREQIDFPDYGMVSGVLKQTLRYGENPHQKAAFYATDKRLGIANAKQLQGKELSYNNIHDADAALQLIMEFSEPAAAIIKHTNPCGVACASTIEDAYAKALASDPVSAFGGIVVFNRSVTESLAEQVSGLFVEAIIAPEIEPAAREILAKKKNMRLLLTSTDHQESSWALKSVLGGFLLQETDYRLITPADLTVVTTQKPNEAQLADLLFAFKVCKHVKSNAIVLAKSGASIGIGAGQMSRVDAVNIAINKALDSKENAHVIQGSVLASDAFFPFPDSVVQAAKAGIRAIIQPGGSIRDEDVIQAANEAGIAMVFTNIRHFRH